MSFQSEKEQEQLSNQIQELNKTLDLVKSYIAVQMDNRKVTEMTMQKDILAMEKVLDQNNKKMNSILIQQEKLSRENEKKLSEIRDEVAPNTLIVGNGDVENYQQAKEKAKECRVDGIMIGRGIFTNPWAFEKEAKEHTKEEYLRLLIKHTKLFEATWEEKKNFAIMKKFFKIYVRNFDGAGELRKKLMECENYTQVKDLVKKY